MKKNVQLLEKNKKLSKEISAQTGLMAETIEMVLNTQAIIRGELHMGSSKRFSPERQAQHLAAVDEIFWLATINRNGYVAACQNLAQHKQFAAVYQVKNQRRQNVKFNRKRTE